MRKIRFLCNSLLVPYTNLTHSLSHVYSFGLLCHYLIYVFYPPLNE